MLKPYFDKSLLEAGCDEAGRGCLAGPVFAAAVVLPKNFSKVSNFGKVNDSKKLSDEVRRELRPIIEKTALAFAIGIVSVEEIDKINILNASFLAMHRAIAKLNVEPELLLIDGNRFKKYFVGKVPIAIGITSPSPPSKGETARSIPHECIIQGDGKFLSIACASILAKTYRDDYMNELHEQFPKYKWNQNKAYATRAHRTAIEKYGATEHHRRSFTLLPSQLKIDFSKK
ncbi:MAG: ribonuclease HII [Bacteroidetes bacterium]|nr:ribonuclease HII [Bacteroidota bacterium]